jgi:hypothetical protein
MGVLRWGRDEGKLREGDIFYFLETQNCDTLVHSGVDRVGAKRCTSSGMILGPLYLPIWYIHI